MTFIIYRKVMCESEYVEGNTISTVSTDSINIWSWLWLVILLPFIFLAIFFLYLGCFRCAAEATQNEYHREHITNENVYDENRRNNDENRSTLNNHN